MKTILAKFKILKQWEYSLFLIVNILLWAYTILAFGGIILILESLGVYFGWRIDTTGSPGVTSAFLIEGLMVSILLKPIILPACFLVIQKKSQDKRILDFLNKILNGSINKLKILIMILGLDIVFILLFDTISNATYGWEWSIHTSSIYMEVLFGGLLGSYMFLFILNKIFPKLLVQKQDT